MSVQPAVRAFRAVAAVLADPLQGWLDCANEAESSALLVQTLPLAGYSPFQSLPDGTAAEPAMESLPEDPVSVPPAGAEPVPSGSHEAPPASTGSPPSGEAPVFSFRRSSSSTPGVTHPADIVAPCAVPQHLEPAASSAGEVSSRVQAEPRAIASGIAAAGRLASEPLATSAQRTDATRTIELLDALASSLLSVPRVLRSKQAGRESTLTAAATPPAVSASAGAVEAESATAIPELAARAAWPPYQEESGPFPIDIFSTPGPSPSSVPPTSSAILPTRGAAPTGPAVASVPRRIHSDPDPAAISSDLRATPPLDAETVASMVNEVLAEQARRHGVDLS